MNIGIGDAMKLVAIIGNFVKDGMTIEAQEKIIELRKKLIAIEAEVLDLQSKNKDLRLIVARKDAVFPEDGVYWTKNDDGAKDGPFCFPCHDNNGKLIRLTKDALFYRCPVPGCGFVQQHSERPSSGNFSTGGNNSWMA